jgi:hypothetical protein
VHARDADFPLEQSRRVPMIDGATIPQVMARRAVSLAERKRVSMKGFAS